MIKLKPASRAAAIRIAGLNIIKTLENPDVLDQVIAWHIDQPRVNGAKTMQRQWTIEARADFADQEKNDAITEAIRRAAVHVHATMALLADGVKPQVVAFSDDFFSGHEEIALMKDHLGDALEQHGDQIEEASVSDELMQAARDLQHDKNNK